jgi:WhiB family transcriptional regulator, redox-sensing transcriptional regulator
VTGSAEEEAVPWWQRGACRDADEDLFFPHVHEDDGVGSDGEPLECIHEPDYASPEAKAICAICPVFDECLHYALNTKVELAGHTKNVWVQGIWAGTSTYTRDLLRRRQDRRSCPRCHSTTVIKEHNDQVCHSCGASWPVKI